MCTYNNVHLVGVVMVQPQNWGEKHSCNILPGVGHLIVFKETSSHLHMSPCLATPFKKFQEIVVVHVYAFQVSEEISLVKTHSHESKAALPSELCQADVAKSRFWAFSAFSSALAAIWTASGVGAPAAAASTRSPFLSADFSRHGHNKMMSVYASHIGQPLLQLPLLWPSHIKLVKVRKPWMKHFQDDLSSLSNTFQQVFQQRRLETGFRDGLVQCDCGLCRGMPSTPSGCCNRSIQCQHEFFIFWAYLSHYTVQEV